MISLLALIAVSLVVCLTVAATGERLGWSQKAVFVLNCLLCLLLGLVWP